ncbi:MAG TPA: helix-turn-helix domain-containing protein [Candidatus Limnocylindrales bacterium]
MPRPERPLDGDGGVVAQFAAELRMLRQQAGSPGYRSLARRANYSAATLASAASGRRLPTLEVTLAYVAACGGDRAEWEARWRAAAGRGEAGEAGEAGSQARGPAPYRGLAAFQPADAGWFFGRQELVKELLGRLADRRFLAVFGPSGVGKSSLLRAGLLPPVLAGALAEGQHWPSGVMTPGPSPLADGQHLPSGVMTPGPSPLAEGQHLPSVVMTPGPSPLAEGQHWPSVVMTPGPSPLAEGQRWPTVVMTPGPSPLAELAVHLAALAGVSAGAALDDLTADAGRAHLLVRQALAARPEPVELLVVVDQFEEMFSSGEPDERSRFIDALLAICQAVDSRARVVIAVRADFYGRCAEHPRLLAALTDAQVLVGEMSGPQLREAITKPAERAGLMVEGALVAQVVAEVTGRPGALPLASHALLEAWRRRRGSTVTLAGYESAGGIDGAVAHTAETAYLGFDEDQRLTARHVLLRLVEIGADGVVTGRRVGRPELDVRDANVMPVLSRLVAARLLTFDRDTVEITHEALIRAWPRLRGWVDEDRDVLRLHRQLAAAAAVWESLGREPTVLYRGIPLSAASQYSSGKGVKLTAGEHEFLAASQAEQRREADTRRRRQRMVLAGMSAVVVVVTLLAGTAWSMANQAAAQRDLAISGRLVASARAQLPRDPQLALLLAVHAYRLRPGPATESVLRQAVTESRLAAVLSGHHAEVTGVAFSPDGRSIASSGRDGTARIWNRTEHREKMVLRQPDARFLGVAFSPDGRRLAVSTSEETDDGPRGGVTLWDLAEPDFATVLRSPDPARIGVTFSPDGRNVATATTGGTVAVWDIDQGLRTQFRIHNQTVNAIGFSPDGLRLAVAGGDDTIRLWPTAGGPPPAELRGHDGDAFAVAFAPDGRHLASGGSDRSVRIWSLPGTVAAAALLPGHESAVTAVAFSPDGRRIATASTDRTIRLWDVANPAHALVLRGHQGTVGAVAFSPDGRQLASGSDDRTVRVWDISGQADPTVVAGPSSSGPTAAGLDGRHAANVKSDGTIALTDIASGRPLTPLRGAITPSLQVALSSSGPAVASLTHLGGVQVWRGGAASAPETWRCDDSRPHLLATHIAISPGGDRVAAACTDAHIRIWTGEERNARTLLTFGAGPVAFSPDGRRLAGTGLDREVKIWALTDRSDPVTLARQDTPINDLAYSLDGQHLATAGADGVVRVWNTVSGTLNILPGVPGNANTVAFNPATPSVASVGSDNTIRVWSLTGGADPLILQPYPSPPLRATFTADGRNLVTTHADHTVQSWPCEACGPITEVLAHAQRRSVRRLTPEEYDTFIAPVSR